MAPTRAELLRSYELLLECTSSMTQDAARRGVSVTTLRRMIRRGEIEDVQVGRDIRVWRDDV